MKQTIRLEIGQYEFVEIETEAKTPKQLRAIYISLKKEFIPLASRKQVAYANQLGGSFVYLESAKDIVSTYIDNNKPKNERGF